MSWRSKNKTKCVLYYRHLVINLYAVSSKKQSTKNAPINSALKLKTQISFYASIKTINTQFSNKLAKLKPLKMNSKVGCFQ